MDKILIVEDDSHILAGLHTAMTSEGYAVKSAVNGPDGRHLVKAFDPDLIILDLMLPGMSGFELCKRLRDDGDGTPIIMLTAKGGEDDKVLGLELGADDYITKPFSVRELLARVKVVLRRSKDQAGTPDRYAFGDVVVNFKRREVTRGGRVVELTNREFNILAYFIAHAGEVVSRDRLLEEVWGYTVLPATRTVDTHMARLRRKIEAEPDEPRYLVTVHAAGYIFEG
jgi:DNA-binding response OmpR family regulator